MHMRVEFYNVDEGRLCCWIATPPKRRSFQGTTMASGRDLPHDLAQFVVEAALGHQRGFWGLLASGATFKSVPGRRLTKPGRQLVRTHLEELEAVEGVVNMHVSAWRRGAATPVSAALDAMYARWRALRLDERLRVEWPIPHRGSRASSLRRGSLMRSIALRSPVVVLSLLAIATSIGAQAPATPPPDVVSSSAGRRVAIYCG